MATQSSTGATADSPIPTPSISPTPAPGKRGPVGLSPRNNYSRVNTGAPPQLDAGASSQKTLAPLGAEMLPKLAGETLMGKMTGRPLLQNLVKEAIASSAQRIQVSEEARLQTKTAGEEQKCAHCGKEKDACICSSKKASASVVEKLASACDYAARLLKEGASLSGSHSLTEHPQTSPPGVSQATASTTLPDKKGQGVNVVPMHPAMQKDLSSEHSATQMQNNQNDAPELHHQQILTNYGKKSATALPGNKAKAMEELKHFGRQAAATALGTGVAVGLARHFGSKGEGHDKKASVDTVALIRKMAGVKTSAPEAEKKETEGLNEAKKGLDVAEKAHKSEPENKEAGAVSPELVEWFLNRVKQAEDAVNPAQISAGKAVAPQTSAAGEAGGAPAGGAPQGPTGLVGSNDSAREYKKDQAYSNRKADLGKYFKEPALSMEHDSVLRDAFSHTPQAGTKFASSTAQMAKRVLLSKLAESGT